MISVLMRSHNDMLYIRRTVEALLEQETDMPVEIISCDDRSTDGTAEYLAGIPQLRRIAPPEGRYVPGKTLNHMVRQARGEYIVFNNGDAIPLHKDYLKNLTAPLKEKSVNCVFGNQIARPEAFAVVRKDYERAFGDGSVSCKWHQFFSLVSSGFRKEELTENPFDETFQYSEDSQWVNRRSVKIVYVPSAVVEHSHNYTLPEVEKRFFNEGVADRQMGKSSPGLLRTWKSIAAETLRDWIYLVKSGSVKEFFYAPRYRYTQKMSYFRGTKS
ncbi:MAG: glycosyltransferase family 2 protein [Lentisphaeria bacterium]|nr:glycosyltransferase family 2 protein [Lentisphaeria bacterium]